MLVWIASYPRSGNTFLRLALFHGHGWKSTSLYPEGPAAGPGRAKRSVLGVHFATSLKPAEMARAPERFFVKTHDLPPDDEHPAVYLVRDGRDALVSYAWFVLTAGPGRERSRVAPETLHQTMRRLVRNEGSPFGSWSENVRAWSRRRRTVVVRFEELIRAPAENVERALVALGLDHAGGGDGVLPSFPELQRRVPRLFRRGQVGSWRDEMPRDVQELFRKHHGETLRQLGYET